MLEEVEKAPKFLNILRILRTKHTGRKLSKVMGVVFPVDFDGLSWGRDRGYTSPFNKSADTNLGSNVGFPFECFLCVGHTVSIYSSTRGRGSLWRSVLELFLQDLVREIRIFGEFLSKRLHSAGHYVESKRLQK